MSLEPAEFQRLANAAMRHDLPGDVLVRPYDPPYGVADGGFDARVEGVVDGHDAVWRLDAKRVKTLSAAKRELKTLVSRHSDLPIILVVAGGLTDAEHDKLVEVGSNLTPPLRVVVRDGAWVEQVMIANPWINDWFFGDRRAAYLVPPLSVTPSGRDCRASLPSEVDATRRALEGLSNGTVAVVGGGLANSEQVLHEIARLSSDGIVSERALWLGEEVHEQLGAELARALGVGLPKTLVLARSVESAAAVMAHPDAADVRMVVATAATGFERLSLASPTALVRVDLLAPSMAEIREWAIAESANRDEVHESERLTLWLGRPDLIAMWKRDPKLATVMVREDVDRVALEVAFYVCVLADPEWRSRPAALRGQFVSRVDEAFIRVTVGVNAQSDELAAAESAGLIVPAGRSLRSDGAGQQGWLPVSPGVADLVVCAWWDIVGTDDCLAAISALTGPEGADAFVQLVGPLLRLGLVDGAMVAQRIENLPRDIQSELLVRHPVLWTTDAGLLRQLLGLMQVVLRAGDSWPLDLVDELVLGVRRHPALIGDALALIHAAGVSGLRSKYANRGVAGLTTEVLSIGAGVPAGHVADGIKWLLLQLMDADEVVVAMAVAALELWTSPVVRWERADELRMVFYRSGWPDGRQVERAFAACGELLRKLLESADPVLRSAGLRVMAGVYGDQVGPDAQQKIMEQALDTVIKGWNRFSGTNRERCMAEGLLQIVMVNPAFERLRTQFLALLTEEPIARATGFTLYGAIVIAPSELQHLYSEKGADEVWNRLTRDYESLAADIAALAIELSDCAGAQDIEAILLEADIEESMLYETGNNSVRPEVMAEWARQNPGAFEPIVRSDMWERCGRKGRALMLDILSAGFRGEVQQIIAGATLSDTGAFRALAEFLVDPASVDSVAASDWARFLEFVTSDDTELAVLEKLIDHVHPDARAALCHWLMRVATHSSPNSEVVDRLLLKLLDGKPQRTVVERVLSTLKYLEARGTINLSTGAQRGLLWDALEALYEGERVWRLGSQQVDWLIPAFIEERPAAFWQIQWDGWGWRSGRGVSLSDGAALLILEAAPEDLQGCEAAHDWLVGQLSEAALSKVLDGTDGQLERLIRVLTSSGMTLANVPHVEAMLERLWWENRDRAEEVARRVASGLGLRGFRVGRVTSVSNFPEHPARVLSDEVSLAFVAAAEDIGGGVGDLLRLMAALRDRSRGVTSRQPH